MTDQDQPEQGQKSSNQPLSDDSRFSGQSSGNRAEGQRSRSRRISGGKSRAAYAFTDGVERCFCRNATRTPPLAFPVTGRAGLATAPMIVLARNDRQMLLCDLLHDGAHLWPDGEPVTPEENIAAG